MTTDAAAATAFNAPAPQALSESDRNRILIYLGALIFIISFGGGGLLAPPLFFILKNRLHLGATQLSLFLLLAALPGYFAFLPGFVRDLWNPFGLRDRGYMIIFGGVSAVL